MAADDRHSRHGGDWKPDSRIAAPSLPGLAPGDKFELVLDKGEHSAFTERPLPGDREQRNPNHHRAILALSTAFWDAYLREDAAAKAWLLGDGPRRILEPADVWQKQKKRGLDSAPSPPVSLPSCNYLGRSTESMT